MTEAAGLGPAGDPPVWVRRSCSWPPASTRAWSGTGPGLRAQHERVERSLAHLSVGNPCAAGPAPIVLALLQPDPVRRPARRRRGCC